MKNAHIKNAEWLAAAGIVAAFGMTTPAQAADWVMLQGVERPDVTHRFFGVVQLNYANNFGCDPLEGLVGTSAVNNGLLVNNCRVAPELRDQKADFYIPNLQVGLRGNLIPGRINYFVAVNAGENAANYQLGNTERKHLLTLTDASLTFSYIPGVRVRVGRMRVPGAEEFYSGLKAKDYMFPTDFISRVYLERMVKGNAKNTTSIPGQGYGTQTSNGLGPITGNINTYAEDSSFGRDMGIQFFDAFKNEKWTHTYAVMIGKGEGIHGFDIADGKYDRNLYWSSEYDLPGGAGPLKHGVKLYAYHQYGVRQFIIDSAGTKSKDFDRIRYGIGAKALGEIFGEGRGKHRLGFELNYAEGMIFHSNTASAADAPFGGLVQIAAERDNKARGITLDYGYYLNKHWQFDVRWSRDNLLYETDGKNWTPGFERIYTNTTLGVNYHFTPDMRLTFNYEFRNAEAPNPQLNANGTVNVASTNNQNQQTRSIGDRFGFRLEYEF
jgi:hypothetical protein